MIGLAPYNTSGVQKHWDSVGDMMCYVQAGVGYLNISCNQAVLSEFHPGMQRAQLCIQHPPSVIAIIHPNLLHCYDYIIKRLHRMGSFGAIFIMVYVTHDQLCDICHNVSNVTNPVSHDTKYNVTKSVSGHNGAISVLFGQCQSQIKISNSK